MTQPRRVIAGMTAIITRRTLRRTHLLRPDSELRSRPLTEVFDGALGETCTPPGDLCNPGLVCAAMSMTSGACEKPAAAGQACRIAVPSQCPLGELESGNVRPQFEGCGP